MKCPRCQQENPSQGKSCPECGTRLRDDLASDGGSDRQTEFQNDDLRRALAEAAEQQAATAEILKIIASSPNDVQPVFETIADSAMRLCGAWSVGVYPFDRELVHVAATRGGLPGSAEYLRQRFPMRPTPDAQSLAVRAIVERALVHVPDSELDDRGLRELGRARGFRAAIGVPMLRGGEPIGAIGVSRVEPGAFSLAQIEMLKTFADQAVIAIENVRLFTELQEKNRALTEAHAQVTESLEQQTATSEILRVIASSPTDVQPVFDTILSRATILLGGFVASITRRVGDDVHMAAFTSMGESLDATVRQSYPVSIDSHNPHAVAIRRCEPHIIADADTQTDIPEPVRRMARARGWRSNLAVPLRRAGTAIGALGVSRQDARGFTAEEVALLQTFADQAVIAIENVRLFTELQQKNEALRQAHAQVTESLEQQTASAEILRVISSSPTDVQPVFDAIARRAARLCEAADAQIYRLDDEGNLRLAASYGSMPTARLSDRYRPSRQWISGRAVIDGRTVRVHDLAVEKETEFTGVKDVQSIQGTHSAIATPLMREGTAIGAILIRRTEVRPFSEAQVQLLETFASQAVIAIENVRLFNETKEALDQQTATSEILRVISGAQTDVQPVFDAIVHSAVQLCAADLGAVGVVRDGQFVVASNHGFSEVLTRQFPRPVDKSFLPGRAILERRIIHVPDLDDPSTPPHLVRATGEHPFRSQLCVPMFRAGEVVGAVVVARQQAGPFTESQVDLLRSFADQAVIAIENARLLNELQARTEELTRSVEQLTALGEVGRAVSSTLDLETVLTTIVSRAVQLSGLDGGVVFEYDDNREEFLHRVATEAGGALAEARRTTRVRKGEGVVGQTALTLEPAQVADIRVPGAYESRLRENLIASGIRAVLAVPMVREDELMGCLVVSRNEPGEFPAETIELLRTFATQSALAIQNARLFREIEQKSRELEAASRHKSEFLANMSHELRTPLNAVIGFSEVLNERMFGELNEKQADYLKDIHASGQHLLSLINDILDLSKIEAGRMELELTNFDLPMTIDNALILVRERAARRSVALHTTVDERLGQIQGDERKIRQVLLNLLSNAIKFTPEGGRIKVGAKPVNGSIEVSVSDTGVGIAPEDQEAVFEEFRQVGTADKKVEGTGLGLALSRKFIELHGGKIWVKSQVGEGSTFTFTVPARRGD